MASDRVRGDKIHKTVILDSSAILMFFEFSLDWEKELRRLLGSYTVVVPTAVIHELRKLAIRRGGGKKAAAALQLIQNYKTVESTGAYADDAILSIAAETKGVVVTNDAELRRRLKKQGTSVIFLRGKKKLTLDN
jgi:rRNA-processing protein FCF1